MKITISKIDDFLPAGIFDVGTRDVPFLRDRPIKNRRSAGHAMNGQWNIILKDLERLPHTVTRETAANRIKLPDEFVHSFSKIRLLERNQIAHRVPK